MFITSGQVSNVVKTYMRLSDVPQSNAPNVLPIEGSPEAPDEEWATGAALYSLEVIRVTKLQTAQSGQE